MKKVENCLTYFVGLKQCKNITNYVVLYHGLGEYSILIGCRVSVKKW